LTNNRLLNQLLPKHQPLIRPLQTLLRYQPHHPNSSARHHPPLMIEIRENDVDPFVLDTEEVPYRDLDIVECDEGCSCGGGVGGLDCRGSNAFLALDYED